jgi:metal-dependent hydrolase (beta-lactamase superfamily II)
MKIKFCGAARTVTGSQHLLEIDGKKLLLDCGLYQGKREVAYDINRQFLFDPKELDAVILSHAHIFPAFGKQDSGVIFTQQQQPATFARSCFRIARIFRRGILNTRIKRE